MENENGNFGIRIVEKTHIFGYRDKNECTFWYETEEERDKKYDEMSKDIKDIPPTTGFVYSKTDCGMISTEDIFKIYRN
jgi:hypothetical protein